MPPLALSHGGAATLQPVSSTAPPSITILPPSSPNSMPVSAGGSAAYRPSSTSSKRGGVAKVVSDESLASRGSSTRLSSERPQVAFSLTQEQEQQQHEPRSARGESTRSSSLGSMRRNTSQDSLANRGRQLLQSFDKARSDYASKYGGDDETATVRFCEEVLKRGAPDLSAKYEVVGSISCGTTSVVCRGSRRGPSSPFSVGQSSTSSTSSSHGLPRDVAIKFARLNHGNESPAVVQDRRRQFEIEAKLQRRCEGPHVVELFEFRIVEGFAVFIMEYLPKTLLGHTVEANREGLYPELQAARHIRSIVEALAVCHKMNVAHLDVKLDNVLCTSNGEAKLCDFGLADFYPVRRAAATPLYAPPEILLEGKADDKSDMWSLGVVLFILLGGYPPFQPDERHDLRQNIVHARYTFREDEGWGEVSAQARDLVSKLLVLDPYARWSAKQTLEHPWLVAAKAVPLPSQSETEEWLSANLAQRVQTRALFRNQPLSPTSPPPPPTPPAVEPTAVAPPPPVATTEEQPPVLAPLPSEKETASAVPRRLGGDAGPLPPTRGEPSGSLTRPPPLRRMDSTTAAAIKLESMARLQSRVKETSRLRSLTQFRSLAEDVRQGWNQNGWAGAMEVSKNEPKLTGVVTLMDDLQKGWKTSGLSGVTGVISSLRRRTSQQALEEEAQHEGLDDEALPSTPNSLVVEEEEEEEEEEEDEDPDIFASLSPPKPSRRQPRRSEKRKAPSVESNLLSLVDSPPTLTSNDSNQDASSPPPTLMPPPGPATTNSQRQAEATTRADSGLAPGEDSEPSRPPAPRVVEPPPSDGKEFLREMYDGCTSPLLPPVWIPDAEATSCRLCDASFSFMYRRHHCRACGQVVCAACSKHRRVVSRVDPSKSVRVCDLCRVSSRDTPAAREYREYKQALAQLESDAQREEAAGHGRAQ